MKAPGKFPPPPEPPAEPCLDRTGFPIPSQLADLWDRCNQIQAYLFGLSKIKSMVTSAAAQKDIAFAEVNIPALLAALTQARQALKLVKPFAVCPTCQGFNAEGCRLCKGRGFLSEFKWNSPCVSREAKEIRFKARK